MVCLDPLIDEEAIDLGEYWFCSTCRAKRALRSISAQPFAAPVGWNFQKADDEAGEPIRLDVRFLSIDSIQALGLDRYGPVEEWSDRDVNGDASSEESNGGPEDSEVQSSPESDQQCSARSRRYARRQASRERRESQTASS